MGADDLDAPPWNTLPNVLLNTLLNFILPRRILR